MKPKPNPTTLDHEAEFDSYMRKWQRMLNLEDWRITKSPAPASKRVMAEIKNRDQVARMATYRLGGDFGILKVTSEELERAAVHEMLHILLFELIELARGNSDAETLESAEHRIIHVLEYRLVPRGEDK